MISRFKLRAFLKRIINNTLSAKNADVRRKIQFKDSTIYKDVEFIINSSVIIHFKRDGKDYYFRECAVHLPLKNHILNAIDDYCDNISEYKEPEKLKLSIKRDLTSPANFKRYIDIPQLYDTDLITILSGEYCDYAHVGLPSFSEEGKHKEFLRFLQYSCCVISIYWSNSYLKYGRLENSNANKQLATYKLSKLLGIENIIPKVELCELNIGGKVRVGTLMDKAEGITPAYVQPEKRRIINKHTFLRDLTNLEYFDALCFQLDHRLDNYNVVYDDSGVALSVVAFDNDASRTFFPFPSMPRKTYAGASNIIKCGVLNRPYIDKTMSQGISRITKEELKKELSNYLTKFQLEALWRRIRIFKKAIANTIVISEETIVDSLRWSLIDVTKELDELKYGKTYYNIYLYDTVMLERDFDFKNRKKCI